jgi:hypothetical protein
MSLLRAKRKRKTPKSEEEIAKRFYNERTDQDGFEIKILKRKGLTHYLLCRPIILLANQSVRYHINVVISLQSFSNIQ